MFFHLPSIKAESSEPFRAKQAIWVLTLRITLTRKERTIMKHRNLALLTTLALALAGNSGAQSLSNTADLKAACETSPGNVVNIADNTAVVVFQGAELPAVEAVTTGCTVVIGSNSTFAVNLVGLSFAGPFNIQSAFKTEVKLQEASIEAASMEWSLPATDSIFTLQAASLKANAGDFALTLGNKGKIEVLQMLSGATQAINAFGTLSISGGHEFQGLFEGANLLAGVGITVSLSGTLPQLSFLNSDVRSSTGAVNFSSSGEKGVLNINESVFGATAINITFGGIESQIKANLSTLGAGNGALVIVAGTGTRQLGLIEITQSQLSATSEINLYASRNGSQGTVLVDASNVNGVSGVRLRTGASGLTSLENSLGSSTRLFQVLTGVGGTCRNTSNTITSPGQRLCT